MTESPLSQVADLRQWAMRHFQRNPPRKFESTPELEPLAVVFIFLCTSAHPCATQVLEPYDKFVHTLMLQYKRLVRTLSLAVHERVRDDPTYEPFPIAKLRLLFEYAVDEQCNIKFCFSVHPGAKSALYTDGCDTSSWAMIMKSVEQHSNASTIDIHGLMLDENECVFDRKAHWYSFPAAKDLVTIYENGVDAIREMVRKGHSGADYGLELVTIATDCFLFLCQFRIVQLIDHAKKNNASESDRKAVANMYMHSHYYGALALYFANKPFEADVFMQWIEKAIYSLKKHPGMTLMKFALLLAYINELIGFRRSRKVRPIIMLAMEENEKGKFMDKELLENELIKL